MFRFASASLLLGAAHGQCPDCAFDLTALEEFSVDFHLATFDAHQTDCEPGPHGSNDADPYPWCLRDHNGNLRHSAGITTSPLPDTFPHEHGSIAVHARNMQLKLDNRLTFPTPFQVGDLPVSGMEIHEELHLNGATGQASFHVESPVLNLCFQLDHLPPVAHILHDRIEMQLQQAEQMAPMIVQQHAAHTTLDGQEVMELGPFLLTDSSHPALIIFTPDYQRQRLINSFHPAPSPEVNDHLAVKFDSYSGTTGNQFSVRACEIESHSATQTLLGANPKVRDFVASRIAQHQSLLQGLLEPQGMNPRFNFIPLEIAESMLSTTPACTNDELVQSPGTQSSTSQMAVLSVASFVMGVAAYFAAFRKKHVTPADDYHQVTA